MTASDSTWDTIFEYAEKIEHIPTHEHLTEEDYDLLLNFTGIVEDAPVLGGQTRLRNMLTSAVAPIAEIINSGTRDLCYYNNADKALTQGALDIITRLGHDPEFTGLHDEETVDAYQEALWEGTCEDCGHRELLDPDDVFGFPMDLHMMSHMRDAGPFGRIPKVRLTAIPNHHPTDLRTVNAIFPMRTLPEPLPARPEGVTFTLDWDTEKARAILTADTQPDAPAGDDSQVVAWINDEMYTDPPNPSGLTEDVWDYMEATLRAAEAIIREFTGNLADSRLLGHVLGHVTGDVMSVADREEAARG